jgi:CubicO group peptidase (beta-lactamase class C family)
MFRGGNRRINFVRAALCRTLVVILLAAPAAAATRAFASGPVNEIPPALLDSIDSDIARVMKTYGIVGLSVSVVIDQDMVWEKGYGYSDVSAQKPARPGTLYRIASITKLFTAFSIMMIQQKGLLDIDQPVNRYLPEFVVQSKDGWFEKLTIRHILTHTSGLPSNRSGALYSNLLAALKRTALVFEPGTGYLYSNIGFDVLGKLIEHVEDTDYTAYERQTILDPLEMNSSYFWIDDERIPVAVGYDQWNGHIQPVMHTGYQANIPSAALCSTVEDLGNLLRFIFNGGVFNDNQLLDTRCLTEMLRHYGHSRGLGFTVFDPGTGVNGTELVGHVGASPGYTSILLAAPEEKTGVVILTNTGNLINQLVSLGTGIMKKLTGS